MSKNTYILFTEEKFGKTTPIGIFPSKETMEMGLAHQVHRIATERAVTYEEVLFLTSQDWGYFKASGTATGEFERVLFTQEEIVKLTNKYS